MAWDFLLAAPQVTVLCREGFTTVEPAGAEQPPRSQEGRLEKSRAKTVLMPCASRALGASGHLLASSDSPIWVQQILGSTTSRPARPCVATLGVQESMMLLLWMRSMSVWEIHGQIGTWCNATISHRTRALCWEWALHM